MSGWRGSDARELGAQQLCPAPIEGCFSILARLLQFCGLCSPNGYDHNAGTDTVAETLLGAINEGLASWQHTLNHAEVTYIQGDRRSGKAEISRPMTAMCDRYSTTHSEDIEGRPQGALATPAPTPLASRSPEPSVPQRTALLPKGAHREGDPQGPSRILTGDGVNYGKHARRDQQQELPGREMSKKSGKAFCKDPSMASLVSEDEDFCSTCLEGYTLENPKIWTNCGHHFHLGCIYEWMERKETCPICDTPMKFEELL